MGWQLIWKYLLIWSAASMAPARRATATPAAGFMRKFVPPA